MQETKETAQDAGHSQIANNNNGANNNEKEKKNKQKDLKRLLKKIDIVKDGEIKAKHKYFLDDKNIDYDQFYDNQYQSFRNPSLNGWRQGVKQVANEIDEKLNSDKYFTLFLSSIGRVYIQKLIEEAIDVKQSGDFENKIQLTEDHVREAFRNQKNSSKDIDFNPVKKIFE